MIKEQISVSVVMSVYNESETWLRESIDSILNQTYFDFEFIIIYDNPGSSIQSNILETYQNKDNRIKILRNKENIGLTKSLNIGLNQAKGKYIARMDADDISYPNRLALQVEYMENNIDCIACGSWMHIFANEKEPTLIEFPCTNDDIIYELLLDNCIPHPSAMIRKSSLSEHSISYDENLRFSQDYGLWCVLSKHGSLANINVPLLKYRISELQISSGKRLQQYECATLIREAYFSQFVEKLGIDKTLPDLKYQIKKSNLQKSHSQKLLWSFYQRKNYVQKYLVPMLNLDIFTVWKYYSESLNYDMKLNLYKLREIYRTKKLRLEV